MDLINNITCLVIYFATSWDNCCSFKI